MQFTLMANGLMELKIALFVAPMMASLLHRCNGQGKNRLNQLFNQQTKLPKSADQQKHISVHSGWSVFVTD